MKKNYAVKQLNSYDLVQTFKGEVQDPVFKIKRYQRCAKCSRAKEVKDLVGGICFGCEESPIVELSFHNLDTALEALSEMNERIGRQAELNMAIAQKLDNARLGLIAPDLPIRSNADCVSCGNPAYKDGECAKCYYGDWFEDKEDYDFEEQDRE